MVPTPLSPLPFLMSHCQVGWRLKQQQALLCQTWELRYSAGQTLSKAHSKGGTLDHYTSS